MQTKDVVVDGRTFKVRELLATELDAALEKKDQKEILKGEVLSSTGLTEEEYSKLTVKERLSIVQAINQLNGISDFQKSSSQD